MTMNVEQTYTWKESIVVELLDVIVQDFVLLPAEKFGNKSIATIADIREVFIDKHNTYDN